MTDEEARARVASLVDGGAMARLEQLVALVLAENQKQNLIGRSTVPMMWTRHILDSVQLVALAAPEGSWLDIGTGGGFPGLAVAAVDSRPMVLAEPRRRRAAFLEQTAAALGLGHVTVHAGPVETVEGRAATISARAVASVENILQAAAHCATSGTQWLLPRGHVDPTLVDDLQRSSGMMFHVEQSLSDRLSSIIIGQGKPSR